MSDFVLRPHQSRAWKLINVYGRFALYFAVGTGKTIAGLAVIREQVSRGNLRWLVVAPIPVIPGWIASAREWFPELRIWSPAKIYGKKDHAATLARWGVTEYDPKDVEAICFREAHIVILNPQLMIPRKVGTDARGRAIRQDRPWVGSIYDGLIVDEPDVLTSPRSETTKTFLRLAGRVNKLILLSGLPSPNDALDLWAQGYALGCWTDKYFSFCQKYGRQDRFHAWSARPDGAVEILRLLKTRAWFLEATKDLGIPDSQKIVRWYRCKNERRQETKKTPAQVEAIVEAAFAGTGVRYEKLRQTAAGFLKTYDQDGTDHVWPVHGDRLEAFMELVAELGDQRAIVWYQHTEIRDQVCRVLGDRATWSGDGVSARELADRWDRFCRGEFQFFVAHPKSIGKGTDGAQKVANNSIWIENTNSYRDWHQATGRLERSGQQKPVFNFCLAQEECAIDAALLDCVEKKKEWADYVQEYLE